MCLMGNSLNLSQLGGGLHYISSSLLEHIFYNFYNFPCFSMDTNQCHVSTSDLAAYYVMYLTLP